MQQIVKKSNLLPRGPPNLLGHKNSLWRQTAVVLPPAAAANLFFTVGRSKKPKNKTANAAT
jgi:hypothetical protein